jgi:hypothetical protein
MSEGAGYGCVSILVFFAVWIGCTIAFGGLGFLFGWAPAIILAAIWPLVAALGVAVLVLGGILLALVVVMAQ